MNTNDPNPHLDRVSLLTAPLRQRLSRFVVGQPDAVTRDQATSATGVSRTLAAYHVYKLADAGLVDVS